MATPNQRSSRKPGVQSRASRAGQKGTGRAQGLQKAVRPSAELAAIVGQAAAAHGDHQEALGLHQRPWPAGRPG